MLEEEEEKRRNTLDPTITLVGRWKQRRRRSEERRGEGKRKKMRE